MLTSLTGLERIREQHRPLIEERLRDGDIDRPTQLLVCTSTACISSGGVEIYNALRKEVKAQGLEVDVVRTGCFGFCGLGPVVVTHPGAVLYCRVRPGHVTDIVEKHLKNREIVEELLYEDAEGVRRSILYDMPFFEKQRRIVLENSGLIDPEDINEYIARDGYFALADVLARWTPEQVVDAVIK
ncbi:NAD(P)H-dependent oxidoreductase subunit E, partial [Desulforudis sp. 1190]|uniref:(2Fe-2S) ferredoxin domain-containing protein n=1 Tax=Desulforudis sp. 1190 TaxID=3416136 RepID=UPI003CFA949F